MKRIEWEDVQRIVLSGYKRLPRSAYVLFRFQPEHLAGKYDKKQWLAKLTKRLTPALPDPGDKKQPAINLALTASGLRCLGLAEPELNSFSLEFIEGMAPQPASKTQIPRRTNILGDLGASSPACWDWGGWNQSHDVDGLLLLFAADKDSLDKLIDAEQEELRPVADDKPLVLKGHLYSDNKEHFGYVDGLSQPKIEGRPKREKNTAPETSNSYRIKAASEVRPGEFLLGYLNERKASITNGQPRDVRRNGTYLVFRQLEQDVAAFNAFLSDVAKRIGEDEEWVAARLLGRWRNGNPLVPVEPAGQTASSKRPDAKTADVKAPDGQATNSNEFDAKAAVDAKTADDAKAADSKNRFLYYYEDRSGLKCPIGAHIRRANPRDSLGPDPETALRLSKMHRIIRRGRPYGERWQANAAKADGETAERGMLFIALNADIAGQFEMIQHSWLNNPHFNSLYTGTDPISHFSEDESITIQSRPANLQIRRPAPFVKVRGGAYFFLPGIRALCDIAASA
jgi:Dyp-type peroxidase family